MLVAVMVIKMVATTGADLNHLVQKILKKDFIIFKLILKIRLEMHQLIKVVLEDSKALILLEQLIYNLQLSFRIVEKKFLININLVYSRN